MGHHQSIRMCAEVGAKGLFGDSAGNVIAFSAIAKRSCQSAATRVHGCGQEAKLCQEFRDHRAFMLGMTVGVHHHRSIVGGESGALWMLVPMVQQKGFEVCRACGEELGC